MTVDIIGRPSTVGIIDRPSTVDRVSLATRLANAAPALGASVLFQVLLFRADQETIAEYCTSDWFKAKQKCGGLVDVRRVRQKILHFG